MLREKSIFFSRVEKEFPFQILLSFQQIISYCFIAVAEDGSLNIAGNHIFFSSPYFCRPGKDWKKQNTSENWPCGMSSYGRKNWNSSPADSIARQL